MRRPAENVRLRASRAGRTDVAPNSSDDATADDATGAGRTAGVLKYYAYKATKAVEFYRPVMYLYFLSLGLSFVQITVVEALYNLATVFGEVPTGYVGDRVGRRNSLLIGTVLIAVVLVGIGLVARLDGTGTRFVALAVLYVLWSMGYNFRSGSEDAWLYDTLVDDSASDAFAYVRGRGESVALAVGVVGAVVGGYLGGLDLTYPWFVAAGITLLGVGVLLSVDEAAAYEDSESEALGFRETLGIVRDALTRREIRAFVVYYYVLFAAVTYLVFIFLQPVFETVVTGQLGIAPERVEPLLGWFYGAYSLVGAALSYQTGWIKETVGLRTWFLALPFVVGAALVGMYALPLLALPTLLLIRGVADTTRSLASQYVNDRIETLGRATVLSAMAMVSGLTVVPFQLGSGVISDAVSPLFALAVAGGVLMVGSALVLAWERPVAADATPDAVD
jgi:MFS family permease